MLRSSSTRAIVIMEPSYSSMYRRTLAQHFVTKPARGAAPSSPWVISRHFLCGQAHSRVALTRPVNYRGSS
jgi:hypothetical protein